MIYVLGDADRVREKVEAALFADNLAALTTFSQTLSAAVAKLAREMGDQMGARIVMAGGDDVLFTVNNDRFDLDVLHRLANSFADTTSCPISFGLGPSAEVAYINLRRAKATGRGIVGQGVGA